MKILIIGGTRFVGPYVIRELAAAGHELAVYHRGENESHLPISVIHFHSPKATMLRLEFEPEVLAFAPDIVLHMISMGEADAQAAVAACAPTAKRIVALSSGDVYRAYERFMGEPGPIEETPLKENSPLREHLFPYRRIAAGPETLEYSYDKILAERVVMSAPHVAGTVLRLPKLYGPGDNMDLATVYRYRHHPNWRWTHGYVENVAHAIALAVMDERAGGKIYNVGEEATPTVGERLASLPLSEMPLDERPANFDQDMIYDTSSIRSELGFRETVSHEEGIKRTLKTDSRCSRADPSPRLELGASSR